MIFLPSGKRTLYALVIPSRPGMVADIRASLQKDGLRASSWTITESPTF